MGFKSISFGVTPVNTFKNNKWKPVKGKYRVSFGALKGWEDLNPHFDGGTPEGVTASIIYAQGVGYFLDNDPNGDEFKNVLGAGRPLKASWKLGTTLIFWPCDSNGQIDKDRLSRGDFDVKNYLFSVDKYNQLREIHAESPLSECDIKINVTDEKFHKMNFVACRDSLYAKIKDKDQELFKKVAQRVKEVFATVEKDMGQDLTIEQVREKLSGANNDQSEAVDSFSTDANTYLNDALDDI